MTRLFFLFLCLFVSINISATPADVANAETSANVVMSNAGSAEDIQKNLTGPILTEQSLTTFDGKSFDAQIMCSATSGFFELFAHPLPTGDLGSIMVQQDTTMDGVYDRVWTPGVHVSGVCANGVISCDLGTWDNCVAQKWVVTGANDLALQSVSLKELGGCYCTNDHCGAGLVWPNLTNILTDMGGGAASALAAKNPYYAISDIVISGTSVKYLGQQTAGCSAGSTSNDSYFSSPGSLSSDAFATAPTNSTYDILTTGSAASQDTSTYQTCEIRRNITMNETTINDIIDFDSGTGMISAIGPSTLRLTLGLVGNNYWWASCGDFGHNVSFNVLQPSRIISATLKRVKYDDWVQVKLNSNLIWSGPYPWIGNGPAPGACELSTEWESYPNTDFTGLMSSGGIKNFEIRVQVGGGGEGYAYAEVEVDTACYLNPEFISDSCNAFAIDPDCDLMEEDVDGVQTFQNYSSTGLVPLEQTVVVNGAACNIPVTKDWFVKKRKYRCKSNSTWDFTKEIERYAYITENSTTTEYKDRVVDDTGAVTLSSGVLSSPNEVAVPACVQVCKTKKTRMANDVAVSGVVMDKRTTNTTTDIFYHECDSSSACPLEAGETLVKGCACLSEWAEAASIMQTLRMAGGDTVCSTGIEVSL